MSKSKKNNLLKEVIDDMNGLSDNITKSSNAKLFIDSLDMNRKDLYSYFKKEKISIESKLETASPIKFSKNWWRAVNDNYGDKPLSGKGGLRAVTRFNRFKECIYLAENENVALKEVRLQISKKPTLIYAIKIDLNNVLDLSTKNKCEKLNVKYNLMMGPWASFHSIKKSGKGIKYYSQYVGEAARSAGFEAILYSSVRVKNKKCIIVFPENLKKASSLKVNNPSKRMLKNDQIIKGKFRNH